MIKPLAAFFALALVLCLALLPTSLQSAPWRAVMLSEGPHNDFYDILFSAGRELKALGLTQHGPHPSLFADEKRLWHWLSEHAQGTRLRFLADGYYSAGWEPNNYDTVLNDLRTRLTERQDVDLILAFGTWAGQEAARLNTKVPIIVCGVTDAVGAGIVNSVVDSGKDNLIAIVEQGRFLRQMDLFHQIFSFRKLGITYTDTPSGRSCAGIDQIETACEKFGVKLVRCTGNFLNTSDGDLIASQMKECNAKFIKEQVDAVFITYNSLPPEQIPQVIEPLVQADIPTISQMGQREVQLGVLAGIASYCFREGRFVAQIMRDIIEGAKPRNLPQLFNSDLNLAINVHTAARIGWSLPLEVLLLVDRFFE